MLTSPTEPLPSLFASTPLRHAVVVFALLLSACGSDFSSGAVTGVRDATPTDCPAGGVVLMQGTDTDRDGELDPGEVETSTPVCNGEDGADSLIRTSPLAPGGVCAGGGVQIDVGADQDDDGQLDDAEIEATEVLCEAVATLLATVDEGPTASCPAGGVRVDSGLDLDGDLVLDEAEVTASERVCHGEGGAVVVARLDDIAAGADGCQAGGRWLRVGLDADGDLLLDDGEITQSTRLCDAGFATLVTTEPEPAGVACAAGGLMVHHGVDVNGDGELDAGEIEHTAVLCHGAAASPASFDETVRDPGPGTTFGLAIARADLPSGQVLAVSRNSLEGVVVFERASVDQPWAVVATLSASFRQTQLAFAGATLLAGAPDDNAGPGRGAVYVYERGATWSLVRTIRDPLGGENYLGEVLFAEGDRFVVNGGATRTHVYERSSPGAPWALADTVNVAGTSSVAALDGDVMLVRGSDRVVVLDRVPATGTWAATATVAPAGGFYGVIGVALDGERMVLGVPSYDLGDYEGAAFVYERIDGQWRQHGAVRPAAGWMVGSRVALAGDTIAFTATTANFDGAFSVFLARETELAGWQAVQELVTPDRWPDGFGQTVAMYDQELWVASPVGLGVAGNGTGGAVHAFLLH